MSDPEPFGPRVQEIGEQSLGPRTLPLLLLLPEPALTDWQLTGTCAFWDNNTITQFLIQDQNSFLAPLVEEGISNLKIDAHSFGDVPEINVNPSLRLK